MLQYCGWQFINMNFSIKLFLLIRNNNIVSEEVMYSCGIFSATILRLSAVVEENTVVMI